MPPVALPLMKLFSVPEGETQATPDFLGALQMEAIPPKIIARISLFFTTCYEGSVVLGISGFCNYSGAS